MVNLLPEKNRRSLFILYYSRFLSIAIFLAALAVLASAAVLLPSYLRANAEADAASRTLAASQRAVDLGAKGGVAGEFAVFTERMSILKTYIRPAEIAPVLSLLSARVPKGVSLTKIVITPNDGGAGTLSVSGKSDTRADLLAFVAALKTAPAFAAASVPVEALAGEVNVPFTLSFPFNLPHS